MTTELGVSKKKIYWQRRRPCSNEEIFSRRFPQRENWLAVGGWCFIALLLRGRHQLASLSDDYSWDVQLYLPTFRVCALWTRTGRECIWTLLWLPSWNDFFSRRVVGFPKSASAEIIAPSSSCPLYGFNWRASGRFENVMVVFESPKRCINKWIECLWQIWSRSKIWDLIRPSDETTERLVTHKMLVVNLNYAICAIKPRAICRWAYRGWIRIYPTGPPCFSSVVTFYNISSAFAISTF